MNSEEKKSLLFKLKLLRNTEAKYRYASHNATDSKEQKRLLELMFKIQEQIKEVEQQIEEINYERTKKKRLNSKIAKNKKFAF